MKMPGNLVGGGGAAVNGIKETYNIAAGQSIKRGDPVKMVTGVNGGAPLLPRVSLFEAGIKYYPSRLKIFKHNTRAFILDSDRTSGQSMILNLFSISQTGEMEYLSTTIVDYSNQFDVHCNSSQFLGISEYEENKFIVIWYTETYSGTVVTHYIFGSIIDLTTDVPSKISKTTITSNSSGTSFQTTNNMSIKMDNERWMKISDTDFAIIWEQGSSSPGTDVLRCTGIRFNGTSFSQSTSAISTLPDYTTMSFVVGNIVKIDGSRLVVQFVTNQFVAGSGTTSILHTERYNYAVSSAGTNMQLTLTNNVSFTYTEKIVDYTAPYMCVIQNSLGQKKICSVFRHSREDGKSVYSVIMLYPDTMSGGSIAYSEDLNNFGISTAGGGTHFDMCLHLPDEKKVLLLLYRRTTTRNFYQFSISFYDDLTAAPLITAKDLQEEKPLYIESHAFCLQGYSHETGAGKIQVITKEKVSATDSAIKFYTSSANILSNEFVKYNIEKQIQKALTRPFDGVAFKGGNGAAAIPDVLDAIPIVTLPE